MPIIDGHITGLTAEQAAGLQKAIATNVTEAVARAFPPTLGYAPGTREFQAAYEIARKVTPHWLWIRVSPGNWVIGGQEEKKRTAARFNVIVLAEALEEKYRDSIARAVTDAALAVLGRDGKEVAVTVSVEEDIVQMTLPRAYFGSLVPADSEHVLLKAADVGAFFTAEVRKAVGEAALV